MKSTLLVISIALLLEGNLLYSQVNPPAQAQEEYRYLGTQVKYESLSNKGVTSSDVLSPASDARPKREEAPHTPNHEPRPMPEIPFNIALPSSKNKSTGSIKREKIPISITEEANVSRTKSALRFGFPLPAGGLFDAKNIQLLDQNGKPYAAQYTPISRWSDGSLKWVLIDAQFPLEKKEKKPLFVEFGTAVVRAEVPASMTVESNKDAIIVNTQAIKAVIDKHHFNILREVYVKKGNDFLPSDKSVAFKEGVNLVDEKGRLFTTSNVEPDSCVIEEQGPERVVVRVKGKYANSAGERYMSYTTRLIFLNGSSCVTIQHTHLDDYLETEFTDISSLTIPMTLPDTLRQVSMPSVAGAAQSKLSTFSVFQADENKCDVNLGTNKIKGGRYNGAFKLQWDKGSVGYVVHEFWQRWPKNLQASGKDFSIGLLPQIPEKYGTDLPYHLMYPFVSGKYRFKWGMSFSQRITIDFSGQISEEELAAEAEFSPIAILPSQWYTQTKAMGPIPALKGNQFAKWDKMIYESFQAHKELSERQREYGYFNYGDWFGERTRNWGNNEYDMAYCLFAQFARTGNTDYYRRALAAARHQADVDIVHAYPDPFYFGANQLHSIGHTGEWVGPVPAQAKWSHIYDYHTQAENGHTWSRGMTDAWFLAGDARVMEATLELGEHITWMAQYFKKLGTHERSAGWSLRAILDIYRVTYDPVYLRAADRIASVALKAQAPGEFAAWPHKLPKDHDPEQRMGNNVFLIGILLDSLKEYYVETQRPEVLDSLRRGCNWITRSWNESMKGWSYSGIESGQPAYENYVPQIYPLIASPLAFVGMHDGNATFIDQAEKSISSLLRFNGTESIGKEFAERMVFTNETLTDLDAYYQSRDPKRALTLMDGTDPDLKAAVAAIAPAKCLLMRGPEQRIFYIRFGKDQNELLAKRELMGHLRQSSKGKLVVEDSAGKIVFQQDFDQLKPAEIRIPIEGGQGKQFKVTINDNESGAWSLWGDGMKTVSSATPGFRIGRVSMARYSFYVPKGTREFSVHILGVHHGRYGMATGPSGSDYVELETQSNPIGVATFPGEVTSSTQPEFTKVIKPNANDTGKMWYLSMWAGWDIQCDLKGVPPWISAEDNTWFDPQAPEQNK